MLLVCMYHSCYGIWAKSLWEPINSSLHFPIMDLGMMMHNTNSCSWTTWVGVVHHLRIMMHAMNEHASVHDEQHQCSACTAAWSIDHAAVHALHWCCSSCTEACSFIACIMIRRWCTTPTHVVHEHELVLCIIIPRSIMGKCNDELMGSHNDLAHIP